MTLTSLTSKASFLRQAVLSLSDRKKNQGEKISLLSCVTFEGLQGFMPSADSLLYELYTHLCCDARDISVWLLIQFKNYITKSMLPLLVM